MKKIILLLLVLSSFLFAGKTIELAGDKDYPPYSYSENGVAKGIYVDIIKLAFSKIDAYDVKFNMMAWKKAITMTKKGMVVGFFPPYYTKSRTKWTKYSEPILEETTIIFAKDKILKNKVSFPKDFFGLTVCLNRGFDIAVMGKKDFIKAVQYKKITVTEASKNKDCLSRVKRGIADFYINDQFISLSGFDMIKRGSKVKINLGHIGFTLKTKRYPFMKDLESKLNSVIKKMKLNGEIDKIAKQYRKAL